MRRNLPAYRIRNWRGKRLEEVGELLVESNPALEAPSFERERVVRKDIGDYTLFLTGMFPEHVAPRRGLRLDSLIDYVKAGKESYRIVGAFDQFDTSSSGAFFTEVPIPGIPPLTTAGSRLASRLRCHLTPFGMDDD
jgi:hypothetical protein